MITTTTQTPVCYIAQAPGPRPQPALKTAPLPKFSNTNGPPQGKVCIDFRVVVVETTPWETLLSQKHFEVVGNCPHLHRGHRDHVYIGGHNQQ